MYPGEIGRWIAQDCVEAAERSIHRPLSVLDPSTFGAPEPEELAKYAAELEHALELYREAFGEEHFAADCLLEEWNSLRMSVDHADAA